MVPTRRALAMLGALVILLGACAPGAIATPTPTKAAATATPQRPPLGGSATPQPTSTPAPTAVAAAPKYGGTLRIVRRAEDPSWDFMRYTGGGGNLRPIAHMVFSMPANWVSANPRPCQRGQHPEVAESWKWLNDTTFEVKVRQGVKFHNKPPVNGRELTAEDMAYSYRRGFFTHPVRGVKVVADQVKDVVARDRYTVHFQTKTPLGILPETLAWNYSLVMLARESGGPKESWEDPATSWIGSGPFLFKEYLPGIKVVLVRNPDYWETGFPYIERVEHVVMADKSTIEAALRSGRIDLWDWDAGQLSVEAIQKTTPGIRVQECAEPVGRAAGWTYFKWDDPLWKDIRVRRAAMLAVDRQPIIDLALLGRGSAMYPYPPVLPVLTKRGDLTPGAQKLLSHNPEEARRLLREAGYGPGKAPEINLIATTRYGLVGPFPQAVELLERFFTDVGFKVKIDWQESARYMSGFIEGKWPPGFNAGVALWSAWDSATITKFHCKASPADNKAGVCDPEYDALVEKWLATTDPDKGWELAKAIQTRIVEQAYGIPGATGMEFALSQPWVKNYTYVNYQFPRSIAYAWLDR